MIRYRKWIRVAVLGLLALPLVLAGCSTMTSKDTSSSIDPPQVLDGGELGWLGEDAQDVNAEAEERNTKVTIYAKDARGFIVPVSLYVTEDLGIAKKTLMYMVQDGEYSHELPKGFSPVLPKGTVIDLDIKQEEKLAIVDFSKEFKNYKPEEERSIVEAITWTLTGFPSVEQVEIRVLGERLKEMPAAGMPMDEPLTRSIGINLEKAHDVDYGQSTPVTLYFSALSPDEIPYFVPVTRFVHRTDNAALTTMAELIAGPLDEKQLISNMMPETEVIDIELQDETVMVNLNDKVLGPDQKVPSEMLQSIVLSLTEISGAKQVQIQVDGKSGVTGSDNSDYSQPVSRPVHPNMMIKI